MHYPRGDPAEVVAAHLPMAAPAAVDPNRAYATFLMAAMHAVEALDGREGLVRGGRDLDSEIKELERARVLIGRFVACHGELRGLRAETLSDFGMPEF